MVSFAMKETHFTCNDSLTGAKDRPRVDAARSKADTRCAHLSEKKKTGLGAPGDRALGS